MDEYATIHASPKLRYGFFFFSKGNWKFSTTVFDGAQPLHYAKQIYVSSFAPFHPAYDVYVLSGFRRRTRHKYQ